MTSFPEMTHSSATGSAAAASTGSLGSLRPLGWMLLGGFIALGGAAMLGNSGVQAPRTVPAIVTAESNAYLISHDHRVFYLRGNAAVEVVGLPNNWR